MLRQRDMIRPVMLINYNDSICQYLLACFAYAFLYPLTSFQRFGAGHLASLLAVSTTRIKWCCLYLDDKLLEAYSDICCMSCRDSLAARDKLLLVCYLYQILPLTLVRLCYLRYK